MPLGAILGALGGLAKVGVGIYQNIQANQIHPEWHQYQTSEYAKNQLGTAQQMFNGRMAGAQDLERNIGENQAMFNANVQRNATDSSQALALAGLSQAQTNNAYNALGIQEAQNKSNMLQNLNNAYGAMTDENFKVYQSQLQKYMMDSKAKADLRAGAWNNIVGGINDTASVLQAGKQYNLAKNG